MEPTPELAPALVADPPPIQEGDPSESESEEFEARCARILEMIGEDPAVRDRVLVELYVTVAEFQAQFSEMQAGLASMGPRAFFKGMFGKGGE